MLTAVTVISRGVPSNIGVVEQLVNQLRQAAYDVQQVATAVQGRTTDGGNLETSLTGASAFALPERIPVKRLLQHMYGLAAHVQTLPRVGIVIDVLADCLWTIMGHLVELTLTALETTGSHNSSGGGGHQQQQGGSGTAAKQEQQQQATSTTSTKPVLLTSSSSSSSSSAPTKQQSSSSSSSSASDAALLRAAFLSQAVLFAPASALWLSLLKRNTRIASPGVHGSDILTWCEKLTAAQLTESFVFTSAETAGPPADNSAVSAMRNHHIDIVVAIWHMMQSLCAILDATVLGGETAMMNRAPLIAETSAFFSSAAAYFLGPVARGFARRFDLPAVSWCSISLSFIPIVDEHFTNGHEVTRELLFEFLDDVMRRFVPEQISTLCAYLFYKFFVAYPKAAECVKNNPLALRRCVSEFGDEAVNFTAEPVTCFAACVVAVATTDEAASSGPDSSRQLALAFGQCIADGLVRSGLGSNPTSSAMAQLMFVCMIQRLDQRRQTARIKMALPPWDERFRLLSPQQLEVAEDAELHECIVDWVSRTLLQYPPVHWYQYPPNMGAGMRAELQKTLMQPFVDAADLVACQSPDGAHLIAMTLLNALTEKDHNYTAPQTRHHTLVFPGELLPLDQTGLVLNFGSLMRFLAVRANNIIVIVEKIQRSLFKSIEAAEPWGKLVPRRLFSESALAFYDIIGLTFSSLASDALGIKNNNAFIQSMLQLTRRLIPLAQPFCLAALESPTTVNQLIDRFEKSMRDVEVGARQRAAAANPQQQQPRASSSSSSMSSSASSSDHSHIPTPSGLSAAAKGNLTFKYLVASFTLSGMTDQQGMRVMPNEVFASRWVPLLARACSAIESDIVTRNLLEVHCRNCCSALLRSRRTVCPRMLLESKEPSVGTTSLYSGPMTTDDFIHHVSTFLGWVIRPLIQPPKSAVSRRMAANTFATVFSDCIQSVERLDNEQGNHVGSDLAVTAVAQAGGALLTQIRYNTAQIGDRYEREVYVDGNSRFASGIASCVASLDAKVRETVQHYVDLILSSPFSQLPRQAKRAAIATLVKAVGLSKQLRGEDREECVMWIVGNEPKWMKDGSEDQAHALQQRSVLRLMQSKL